MLCQTTDNNTFSSPSKTITDNNATSSDVSKLTTKNYHHMTDTLVFFKLALWSKTCDSRSVSA